MATTVGSHAVAQFTSPVNQTSPIDANQVRGNDNTLRTAYVAHDADAGVHVQSSTLASRPVASVAGRKWITADTGAYTLWYDDGSTWHEVSNASLEIEVLADANLVAGDVVKVTGYNNGQSCPTVNKVASAADVAFGIVKAAIGLNTKGYIVNTGTVRDVNTNAHAVGTILYPDASGGLTATKPTSGNYQVVAYVLRQNTNNGVLYVEFSAPRIVERSDNTVGTVVLRDGSGNFSAGTITAALTGNASTATQLSSNRTFALTGDVTGSVSSNLSSGASISTAIAAGVIVNDDINASAAIADTKLATISTAGKVSNSATTATSANTASAIVARDASGNFSAGTITANLTGDISGTAPAGTLTGTTLASNVVSSSLTSVGTLSSLTVTNPITGSVTGSSGSTTGNAATATALQTARTINGTSFDGTADITVTAAAGTLTGTTLASNVVSSSLTSVGTLSSLTVTNNITSSNGIISAGADFRLGGVSYSRVADYDSGGGFGGGYNLLIDSTTAKYDSTGAIAGYHYKSGGTLELYTGSSQAAGTTATARLIIDASGNLGLGTATMNGRLNVKISGVDSKLVVQDGFTSGNVRLATVDDAYAVYKTMELSAGEIRAFTGSTERARITAGGHFIPGANNAYSLGDGSTRWTEVFAINGTINTSDANAKTDVQEDVPGWEFVKALRPVHYVWKVRKREAVQVEDGTELVEIPAELDADGSEIAPARTEERPKFRAEYVEHPGVRRHLGFIAQEVKEALGERDFGLFTQDAETGECGLRYDQFAAPFAKVLQEAMARIETLEARLAALEAQ